MRWCYYIMERKRERERDLDSKKGSRVVSISIICSGYYICRNLSGQIYSETTFYQN